MGSVQFVLAMTGLWSLAAFGAGVAGLVLMIIDLRIGLFNAKAWRTRLSRRSIGIKAGESPVSGRLASNPQMNISALAKASIPYLVLIIVVVLGQLAFQEPLSVLIVDPHFPEVITRFGWLTPAGPGRTISLLGHAGALLMYTSLLSFLWFRWRGTFRKGVPHGPWLLAPVVMRRFGRPR